MDCPLCESQANCEVHDPDAFDIEITFDGKPVQVHKTNQTPSSWPIGKNVLWEYGGNVTLFAWQGDRWANYGRVPDEA